MEAYVRLTLSKVTSHLLGPGEFLFMTQINYIKKLWLVGELTGLQYE